MTDLVSAGCRSVEPGELLGSGGKGVGGGVAGHSYGVGVGGYIEIDR